MRKFAVVTGASTGIGRALAVELGKQSMIVALVARRKDKLEQTKLLVEKEGGKAVVFETDLNDISSINTLIQKVKSSTEKVDTLINVAVLYGKIRTQLCGF